MKEIGARYADMLFSKMTDDIVLRRDGKREGEGKPPSPFLYIGLPECPVGSEDNEKPPFLPGELFS